MSPIKLFGANSTSWSQIHNLLLWMWLPRE